MVWLRAIPSLLSALRLAAAPLMALAVMQNLRFRALVILVVAGMSDFLDGFLARRYGWTTRLGAWLDAVADKSFLVTAYISLALAGMAPAWLVWLVLGRDAVILLLAAGGILFTPYRDFPPSRWGKLSTIVQIATAVVLLAAPGAIAGVFVTLCAAATIVSGSHYIYSAVARLRALGQEIR